MRIKLTSDEVVQQNERTGGCGEGTVYRYRKALKRLGTADHVLPWPGASGL
jgi:hypothetical protein